MANIAYGPASPNATQGASTQKHSAVSKGISGGANIAFGPHSKDNVSEGGRLPSSLSITVSGINQDMQTDASNQALSAIRGMKLANAVDLQWSKDIQSAQKSIR